MLHLYGWSNRLDQLFMPHATAGLHPARIITQHRDVYGLITENGEGEGRLSGRFMFEAKQGERPLVGDYVACMADGQNHSYRIEAMLPRHSLLRRKMAGTGHAQQGLAANLDKVLIATALDNDFNLARLERTLAMVWQSGASPVILLTKADLATELEAKKAEVEEMAIGVPVIGLSALNGEGVEAVRAHIGRGITAALIGTSGVGKSTLVNALMGKTVMEVNAIRATDGRGQHTTTHRHMLVLPDGGCLIDTPGMREFGLYGDDVGVTSTFADLEELAQSCRFRNCSHSNEPDCAVRAAIEAGEMSEARLRNYNKLKNELAFEARKDDVHAQRAHKSIHKSRMKALRAMMRPKDDLS